MEGKFAGEGLQTLDEDDDMLTSMAKELVQKNGIGESADMVWKRLNAEHQRLFPARAAGPETNAEILPSMAAETQAPADALIDAALDSHSVLVFGQRPEVRNGRRRPHLVAPEQGLLFR